MKDENLIDIERAVLGSMLCSAKVFKAGIQLFNEKDFKVRAHRLVFQSLLALNESDQAIDCVMVSESLRKQGSLALVGGASAVAELINYGSDISPLEYYAKRLRGTFGLP